MKITPPTAQIGTGSGTASGAAGGDLGGTFPGPTVISIGGVSIADFSAQFLTVIRGGAGTTQNLGSLGSTETIDLANANYFFGTLDQDCTIGFTGWTNGKDCQITVELLEDGTGGWTPTFSGVSWIGGTTPTHDTTAGTVSIYIFLSRDGGTTIYGALAGSWANPDSTGHYELLMAGGITSPPEPMENGAGDDWLYVWVPA